MWPRQVTPPSWEPYSSIQILTTKERMTGRSMCHSSAGGVWMGLLLASADAPVFLRGRSATIGSMGDWRLRAVFGPSSGRHAESPARGVARGERHAAGPAPGHRHSWYGWLT